MTTEVSTHSTVGITTATNDYSDFFTVTLTIKSLNFDDSTSQMRLTMYANKGHGNRDALALALIEAGNQLLATVQDNEVAK